MFASRRHRPTLRALAALGAVATALLGSDLTSPSSGDLQSQINASKSAAASLQQTIAADTAQIERTTGGLQTAEQRLSSLQAELGAREAELRGVQGQLVTARDDLVQLENRLRVSSSALAANLVAAYEGPTPDLVSVILNAHGFSDLLEQMAFLRRVGNQDARIVGATKTAKVAVTKQAGELASLEQRDRGLTNQVLAQRNQVASLRAALLSRQIAEVGARKHDTARLQTVNGRLSSLSTRLKAIEARAAAAAARAAKTQNATVSGGIAVDTGGMVQAPPGAPAAVAKVIAAGNAIATLPYIYGGGHASFQASGYDCSGSVSYALAAAGLLSSPLDSTGFESWGDPGPGRWITVYANAGHAFMIVAGWRFDTVALAEGGTRWSHTPPDEADLSSFVQRHPPGL
jgi:peptidoglycan hydrolase CwlO-like protein